MGKGIRFDWAQLVKEQSTSGLTISEFCASRGITERAFKENKYKPKRLPLPEASFVEITPSKESLTVRLKNGRSLEVRGDFDERAFRRLIQVLESC